MFAKKSKLPPITDKMLLQPATELSKQIKAGVITSTQVVEAYIKRLKIINPIINGMCEERFVEALDEANKIDGLLARFRAAGSDATSSEEFGSQQVQDLLSSPLLGIPITVKESIAVKGKRFSCGLWPRRESFAEFDATIVQNIKRFGLIPVATSNVPEGTMYWADCQNKVYGKTVNPYDSQRVPGASSGGEGALLAAGGSVVGIGSDIGGSLRLPAHFCGIFSHKATPFLVACDGNYPPIKENRLRMFTFGPMTRYANDLRPLFKCMLRDVDGAERDKFSSIQPADIAQRRAQLITKLDEQIELSQVTLVYAKHSESRTMPQKVRPEIETAQQEIINALSAKYQCKTKLVDFGKFFDQAFIAWQYLLEGTAAPGSTRPVITSAQKEFIDEETGEDIKKENKSGDNKNIKQTTISNNSNKKKHKNELKELLCVDSVPLEFLKMLVGSSKHTHESMLTLMFGLKVPTDDKKRLETAQKYEKLVLEQRKEFDELLGDDGVLIVPTLTTFAYKHNEALFKLDDAKFTAIFNSLQVPVTCAPFGLSDKEKLPFGFSCVAKQFNDRLTLAVAEAIGAEFGGWKQPPTSTTSTTTTISSLKNTDVDNSVSIATNNTMTTRGVSEQEAGKQYPSA